MAKRSHGEGSISERSNGTWLAQVTIGGRRISKSHKTKKLAAAWVREKTQQAERGLSYQAAKETLAEYLARWLASKEHQLAPTSFYGYSLSVNKYIVPELGEVPLAALTPDLVQYTWDSYLQDGVGVPTIIKAHDVLHAALGRAVKTGQVFRNVLDAVEKPVADTTEMKIWTEAESRQFLAAARDNRLYGLFYLALVTGARQMELAGLQWKDINWSRRTLSIVRKLERMGPEMYGAPKTAAGRRTLVLGQGTMDVLQEHLEHQSTERLLAGSAWREHDLVFTSTIGTPMHHKNLMDRYFDPLVERAGVTDIRFHDLRHTAASLMIAHREPINKVSRILGHARVSITLDVYGHLIPSDAGGIELMEDLVTPSELAVEDLAV